MTVTITDVADTESSPKPMADPADRLTHLRLIVPRRGARTTARDTPVPLLLVVIYRCFASTQL